MEEGFQEEDDHISRAEGGGKGLGNKIYIKMMSKEKELLNKTKRDDGAIYINICRSMRSSRRLNAHRVNDFIAYV